MIHEITGFNEAYVKVGDVFILDDDPSKIKWVVVRYSKPGRIIVERADGVKMTPSEIEAYYAQLRTPQ